MKEIKSRANSLLGVAIGYTALCLIGALSIGAEIASRSNEETTQVRMAAVLSMFEDEPDLELVERGRRLLDSIRQEANDSGFSDADVIRAIFTPVLRQARGCECWACSARRHQVNTRSSCLAGNVPVA